jgi:polyisoprenoid-binding protein YceI
MHQSLMTFAGIALAGSLATVVSAAVPDWSTDRTTSTVTMYATQQGEWFDGVFADFDATIEFDPASPGDGRIEGIVRTNSIDTGDSQKDAYVRQYLEVDAFAEARFESTTIEANGDAFVARGELTLVGRTRPAVLQFRFTAGESADRANFFGEISIDRFEFDIASDIDTGRAGRVVTVQIELDLAR